MECAALTREGAGSAKPPKHLWRQPRTHIRIKQRYHSDNERYLSRNKTVENHRPGLKKPRMSWPSSLHKRLVTMIRMSLFKHRGNRCVSDMG
ncbi:cAMP-specific 3',5'-cyclic phosphodiesterase 4C isoform X1 [Silurus asotus]|uniref:cAMP-specific 3',5'-cyclic phosphodiesterase 4C isoform X1 n=1 Tax=Silurus asotus TaxID=30991 RepID=A0AAD5FGL1_SILAS|nr:cAMP-specific 3',5'-cyclic phosphodiesterase 4C isoform X1 [Silurus asotus]